MAEAFDFPAYARAFIQMDVERVLEFYAEDAEWIEYTPDTPPRAPGRLAGKRAIRAYLRGVAESGIGLAISDEVVGQSRAAFTVTCDLGSRRRSIENVILTLRDGLIVRQVEVEVWD